MLNKLLFIFICSLLSIVSAIGQNDFNTDADSSSNGKIIFIKDKAIDEIINLYIQYNNVSQGVEGYRVQVYNDSGNNARSRSMEIKESFESSYPDIPAHLQYQQPNFRVRVGNCRSRLDAFRIQNNINDKYPDTFVVKDFLK